VKNFFSKSPDPPKRKWFFIIFESDLSFQ
jgi:hypothetical protein